MGRGDVVPIVHRRSTYIFSPNLLGITALSNLFDSGERHSRVQPLLGGIEIVIPARSGFATAFLGVWLCGWMPLWGDGTGPLLFDYGFRTVHVADGVSPAEARIIASEIREHARLLAP